MNLSLHKNEMSYEKSNIYIDTQTHEYIYTYIYIYIYIYIKRDRQTQKDIDILIERQMGRKTDRQTEWVSEWDEKLEQQKYSLVFFFQIVSNLS